jgi:hypothetical protein
MHGTIVALCNLDDFFSELWHQSIQPAGLFFLSKRASLLIIQKQSYRIEQLAP